MTLQAHIYFIKAIFLSLKRLCTDTLTSRLDTLTSSLDTLTSRLDTFCVDKSAASCIYQIKSCLYRVLIRYNRVFYSNRAKQAAVED